MSSPTMTLQMTGLVSLDGFALGITHFAALVRALKREVSPNADIAWIVDRLHDNGATIRGEADDAGAVEPVADAFLKVGEALAKGQPVPFSRPVGRAATELLDGLDTTVESLRFASPEMEVIIATRLHRAEAFPPAGRRSYGAVVGQLALAPSTDLAQNRVLLHRRGVTTPFAASLTSAMYEQAKAVVGQRVELEGWLTRDATTDEPLAMHTIRHLTVLPEPVPGEGLRRARGVMAGLWPAELDPVAVVRRLRDE